MTSEIIKNLQEIEQQQQVRILYAVESGSRDGLFREMLHVCYQPG